MQIGLGPYFTIFLNVQSGEPYANKAVETEIVLEVTHITILRFLTSNTKGIWPYLLDLS